MASPSQRGADWPGGGIEFHFSHGDWIRGLRTDGFVVEALHEFYARGTRRPTSTSHHPVGQVAAEWRTSKAAYFSH